MSNKWTIDDMKAGRCDLDDIGCEKPPEATAEITDAVVLDPIDPALPLDEKVRKGLEKHLDRVGYDSIWKDSPEAVLRAAVKMIAPPAKPVAPLHPAFGNVNPFPWVTPERLKAMQSIEVADDIKAKALPPPDDLQ